MYKKIGILALIISSSLFAEETTKKKDYGVRLNESTITSDRYETPVIETAKNITVISSEEIEKRGYQNVEEALVSVPGIMFDSFNGSISMRGQMPLAGKNNIMVLVNGIPQNGLDNRDYDLDFIPIEQIEKIEVLPAGGAIMYGGNATAGVVNIITKEAQNKKYWGNAGLTIGSFNERKYKLNYGTNINDKLSLEGQYINTDKDGYRKGEFRDSEYAEITTNYKLNEGNIGLKYIRNERKSNWGGSLNKKQMEADRKYNSNPKNYNKNIEDKYILTFNKNLTENFSMLFNTEYKEREYRPIKNTAKSGFQDRVSAPKDTKQWYTNTQFKYVYYPDSYITLGGDYSVAEVKEKSFDSNTQYTKLKSFSKADYNLYAGYIMNKFTYNDFIFTQGFRLEKSEFDEDNTTVSTSKTVNTKNSSNDKSYDFAINYLLNDTTSMYVSFNRTSRAPSIREYSRWNETVSGDPQSQTTTTYEAGLKSIFDNIYLSGAVYFVKGKSEIVYDPDRDKNDGSYYNIEGETKRKGIELASEQYFDKLTLRESLTYIDHEITSGKYKGNEIPGISNFIGNIGFTYTPIENLDLNLDTRFVGKAVPSRDFYNKAEKTPGYAKTDVSVRYNFENGLTLSGGIKNIFDKKYCDYIYLSGSNLAYFPSPERTYYVSAEYKF